MLQVSTTFPSPPTHYHDGNNIATGTGNASDFASCSDQMDPNSGAAATGAPQQRAEQLHMQRFCPEHIAHNAKQLYYIRSVTTSVAGSTAGVLGLVNLSGFYLYLASIVLTNAAIFFVNVHARPRTFLLAFNAVTDDGVAVAARKGGLSAWAKVWPYVTFIVDGAQEMAFGYVLWWTLWTALIHVFD